MTAGAIYKQPIILSFKKKVSTAFVRSVFFEKVTKATFSINRQL